MKKQLFLRRTAKLICLFVLIGLFCDICSTLCSPFDNNKTGLAGFYAEPKDSIDVVLIGASEVFADFSSPYAYALHGFTSYPYALDASSSVLYEAEVREILKRQHPKWIVIEINGLLYDDPSMHTDEGGLRRFLDNIPMSLNKVNTIAENLPRGEWLNYLFPLAKYHSNWKTMYDQLGNLKSIWTFYLRGNTLLKGCVSNSTVVPVPEVSSIAGDYSRAALEPQSEQHLRSFLEFCKEENLTNVLFVRFPHSVSSGWSYGRFQRCNEAQRIIEENGFDFINMERDYQGIGLDFSTDFYNEDHLNVFGQRKFTEYFSCILSEQYGLGPTVLTASQKENWDLSAQYTQRFHQYLAELSRQGVQNTYWETCDLIELLDARQN